MNTFKILSLSILFSAGTLYAQNETDALKYSQSFLTGTARSQGVAGAFGAVGADFSSTAINPAGLGLYRRNEMVFGMGITSAQNSTTYFGNTLDDSRYNFNIPSWGGVATKVFSEMGQDVQNGLVSISLGGGMNRLYSYQENTRFAGVNTQTSLLDYFKYSAAGLNASDIRNDFLSYSNIPGAAAYDLYLLDTAANDSYRYTALTDGVSGYKLFQQQQLRNRGAANEYNISGGANLSNRVYLGAGLVLRHAYSESTILISEDAQGTVPDYYSSSLKQELNSSGTGWGGRLGIIVRPVDFLKVGFAAKTPVRMKMRDDYKYIVSGDNAFYKGINDPGRYDYFEYDVITPASLTTSASLTLANLGFISVDFESVDYTKMRIESASDFFTVANNNIKTNMARSNNLRLGAEIKLAEFYRLRAGYANYGNPYKNGGGENLNRQAITGGIGFLVDRIFVDFAVVNSFGKQNTPYYPSATGDVSKPDPQGLTEYNTFNFVLSGGIRF